MCVVKLREVNIKKIYTNNVMSNYINESDTNLLSKILRFSFMNFFLIYIVYNFFIFKIDATFTLSTLGFGSWKILEKVTLVSSFSNISGTKC